MSVWYDTLPYIDLNTYNIFFSQNKQKDAETVERTERLAIGEMKEDSASKLDNNQGKNIKYIFRNIIMLEPIMEFNVLNCNEQWPLINLTVEFVKKQKSEH